jgi:drug/metabolite transporter (DMT)-like permease
MWGFGFVAVKDNVDVVPPVYMMAFRFTGATALLATVFWGKLKRTLTVEVVKHGAFLSVFLFVAYAFQTIGIVYTTAGKNAFLTTVYVIFVPFLGWVLSHRAPGKRVMAAAAVAIVGIGLLSLQDDLTMNKGDVLTLVCGVFYALHILFIAKFTQTDDPIVLTVVQLAFTAIFSWAFAPLWDGAFPVAAVTTAKPVAGLLYMAIFPTSIAFILQNVCQKYTAPSTAAILLSLESLFGALCGVIFLGELMTARMIVGAALLFGAILLSEL